MNTNLESSKLSVSESLTELLAKIGENILIKRLDLYNLIITPILKSIFIMVSMKTLERLVLLSIKYDNNTEKLDLFTKNLAMHIAAMSPKSIDVDDLDKKLIEREKIFFKIKKKSNKPDEIKEKIINGKLNKFYGEVCLLKQDFVMENKTKVNDYVNTFEKENNCNIEIQNYFIYKVGETS